MMCFYNEGDWYVSVQHDDSGPATKQTKCDECRAAINVGDFRHSIWQQEHEECRACEDESCDCKSTGKRCCNCETPDYGETYSYVRCEQCDKFLKAVYAVEEAEGCPPGSRQPMLCGMFEDIGNGDRNEAKRYVKQAAAMFPELKASGYLGKLWGMMF